MVVPLLSGGCTRSGASSREHEIGLPPVADTVQSRRIGPVSVEAPPDVIDAAVGWAVTFPGNEMAIVRSRFEEWGGVGFVKIYSIKTPDDRQGEVTLRIPAAQEIIDERERLTMARARAQGADGYTFDRAAAAARWWNEHRGDVLAKADVEVGRFGDPRREELTLRVLKARVREVTRNGGYHAGWYGAPWNGDAQAWLEDQG